MNEINEEKRKIKPMTKLRPNIIYGIETGRLMSVYGVERSALIAEHEEKLAQLDREFQEAQQIAKGAAFPPNTTAYKMYQAMVASAKEMNGLDPDKPIDTDIFKMEGETE